MKSKSKTSPLKEHAGFITGSANAMQNAYNANAPKIQDATDQTMSLLPNYIDKARNGNPALNAAQGYVTDTLGGNATNPHLDQWISQAQDDAENRMGARLMKMGLSPAGSTYQGNVGREVGKIGLGMRYEDWIGAQQRKAQAAGMAPGIAAGDAAMIAPVLAIGEAASNPTDAAARYGAGMGGLLGPYSQTKQKRGLGGALMGLGGSVLSGWASGGFK